MFACHGVDTLHCRKDTQLFAISSHGKVFFLHIGIYRLAHKASYLEVAKAKHLSFA